MSVISPPAVDVALPPPPDRRRRNHRRKPLHSNRVKLLFVLPALFAFLLVVFVPVFINLGYAMTNWNGFSPTLEWVGFDNFIRLLGDPGARQATINTLIFTLINAPVQLVIGLILALSLNGSGPVRNVLRVVIVMPIAISGVVIGFLGTIIFDPRSGLLAAAAGLPGLSWVGQNYLGNPALAMGTVIIMDVWRGVGLTMLIFLAGLATIPSEVQEAATLDGANPWQRFTNITWPLLAPSATINVVLGVIGGLKVWDIIYVLTNGGPGRATESIVMHILAQGSFGDVGYSAATSFAMTIFIFVISALLLVYLRRREMKA
ncbi:MAG: sugar ABC transporter permease [Mycetocola sp.]